MGYTKLFDSITRSTIWREDHPTRIMWITMLALRNERNIVESSVPGLADTARVTMEECLNALEKFQAPDKWSRNQEHEGRRIREVPGGWEILNGQYYKNLMSKEDRNEYQRIKQAEYRADKKTADKKAAKKI